MGDVLDRAMADPAVLGAVAAVLLLAVVMAVPVVRGLRRRTARIDAVEQSMRNQIVGFAQDHGLPDPYRDESYEQQCLRELREGGVKVDSFGGRRDVGLQLRDAVDRKIAERPAPDYAAEIAAIEEFARKRGLP